MAEKKREAEAAIDLMTVQYERVRSDEEKRNGLIIEKAVYGKIESDRIIEGISSNPLLHLHRIIWVFHFSEASTSTTTAAPTDQLIDVTIPLQCLVKDSKLILHNSNKVSSSLHRSLRAMTMLTTKLFFSQSELPGFYDPCVGEDKSLQIDYTFNGVNHRIVIKDNELLRIPTSNVATPGTRFSTERNPSN